jgi:hypothetical protein
MRLESADGIVQIGRNALFCMNAIGGGTELKSGDDAGLGLVGEESKLWKEGTTLRVAMDFAGTTCESFQGIPECMNCVNMSACEEAIRATIRNHAD